MKEFDFDSVWKNSDEQADKFYRSVEPKILEMAQQQSSDILATLRRNMIKEWVLSFAGLLFLGIVLYSSQYYFLIMTLGIGLTLVYSIPYLNVLKEIKEVSTFNTVDFIKSYIKILDTFIKRLKIFTWGTMPFAVALGVFISFDQRSDLEKLIPTGIGDTLITFLIFGVVIGGMSWVIFKHYIPKLYGNRKLEMENLLENLKNQEC